MKHLIGNKENGIIDLREIFYYWVLMLMIGYTLRAISALINNETIISIL